ncbi:hypothetical protein RISK_001747 [Rhodopirellula islandica]|uniref:Uncharacterized protein n=1 Tax=Rhodopirellula islandica TaxID=595434 RepID=A0A0J1BJ04_RHOIS|nr:hypothetical protein RISK_001747 [Rhodopirellula islandica]
MGLADASGFQDADSVVLRGTESETGRCTLDPTRPSRREGGLVGVTLRAPEGLVVMTGSELPIKRIGSAGVIRGGAGLRVLAEG